LSTRQISQTIHRPGREPDKNLKDPTSHRTTVGGLF
jgi:hypothetical protein